MKWTHRLLYSVLMVIGLLGVVDTIVLSLFFDVSINLGVILPGLAGLLIVFYSLNKLLRIDGFQIPNGLARRVVQVIFALGMISFIFVEIKVISAQTPDRDKRPEYIIILGAGLKGEQLSPTLESRMKLGLEYLQSYPTTKVIVSGGQGPGEDITEAEAMRRYLVDRGISQDRIIKEENSTSTIENLIFSKRLISQNTTSREILIITNDFHMFRAKMLAKRAGLIPYGISAKTPYYLIPNNYLREYFALIKSYFFDEVSSNLRV